MEAIVTGGAGFLGSHLVDRLVREGMTVFVVDNLSSECRWVGHGYPNVRLWAGDVRSDQWPRLTVAGGAPKWIFHCASPGSVAAFLRDPEGTITTNVLGLARCLEVARDGASVVFISSSEAYGDETRVPLREDLTTRVRTDHPRACYEQAKLAGEALLFAARQSGVRGVAVRLFTTYGERLGLDRRMMGTFVMAALTGVPLLVDGGGGQLQTACYVGDIVEGLIRLARLGDFPSPINLGSPEGRPVREIAEAVVETLKSPSRIDVAPPRPGPDARVPSIDRVRQLTGWSPTAPLQEGVERMAEFYRRFRKGNEGWELTK